MHLQGHINEPFPDVQGRRQFVDRGKNSKSGQDCRQSAPSLVPSPHPSSVCRFFGGRRTMADFDAYRWLPAPRYSLNAIFNPRSVSLKARLKYPLSPAYRKLVNRSSPACGRPEQKQGRTVQCQLKAPRRHDSCSTYCEGFSLITVRCGRESPL
ncbi:unnamed protein product [Arctia plantaginis]|uniref:Uncharacterized protein n=1 Tax=Arctia plantaginis TaxID=874455 RepID=A0A8S1AVM2_ARCPL|nr:unnamed protein product [Arctia plantaginis]